MEEFSGKGGGGSKHRKKSDRRKMKKRKSLVIWKSFLIFCTVLVKLLLVRSLSVTWGNSAR